MDNKKYKLVQMFYDDIDDYTEFENVGLREDDKFYYIGDSGIGYLKRSWRIEVHGNNLCMYQTSLFAC